MRRSVDHCEVRGRRRGAALIDAIHRAVLEELAEHGYADLTMESVAARARTGKTSIYRRWRTKRDLVLDALLAAPPDVRDEAAHAACPMSLGMPDGLTTAEALSLLGRRFANIITESAEAIRALGCEASKDPELAGLLNERFHLRWRQSIVDVLLAAAERGEVSGGGDLTQIAELLPAFVTYRTFILNVTVTDDEITNFVTDVLFPLLAERGALITPVAVRKASTDCGTEPVPLRQSEMSRSPG